MATGWPGRVPPEANMERGRSFSDLRAGLADRPARRADRSATHARTEVLRGLRIPSCASKRRHPRAARSLTRRSSRGTTPAEEDALGGPAPAYIQHRRPPMLPLSGAAPRRRRHPRSHSHSGHPRGHPPRPADSGDRARPDSSARPPGHQKRRQHAVAQPHDGTAIQSRPSTRMSARRHEHPSALPAAPRAAAEQLRVALYPLRRHPNRPRRALAAPAVTRAKPLIASTLCGSGARATR